MHSSHSWFGLRARRSVPANSGRSAHERPIKVRQLTPVEGLAISEESGRPGASYGADVVGPIEARLRLIDAQVAWSAYVFAIGESKG